MRYNLKRPIILIVSALAANLLVTNVCLLFGLNHDTSNNLGFIAMMIMALVTYNRLMKGSRKKK